MKRDKKTRLMIIVLVSVMLLQSVRVYGFADNSSSDINITTETDVFTKEAENVEWPILAQKPNGKSAILMEPDTGAVLYSNNPDEKLYPASITKILTGLLAVENLNLSDTITITREMTDSIPVMRQSREYRQEVITVKDCIYSLMLRSNADMAVALAYAVAGSEEGFAKMMTERKTQHRCRKYQLCQCNRTS